MQVTLEKCKKLTSAETTANSPDSKSLMIVVDLVNNQKIILAQCFRVRIRNIKIIALLEL